MKNSPQLPQSVKNVLWSYDINKIDLDLHHKIIIAQVLNFGSEEAIDWLFQIYGAEKIRTVANRIPLGQWDRKSLALWSLCLGISPKAKSEKVLHG